MGLFDTVRCEYRLPNPAHQDLEFQTKDLDCLLDHYVITLDGRLIRLASEFRRLERDIEWPYHGDIQIYAADPQRKDEFVDYTVRFTHGRVEWIWGCRPIPCRADTRRCFISTGFGRAPGRSVRERAESRTQPGRVASG